jgi:hypothetical protein
MGWSWRFARLLIWVVGVKCTAGNSLFFSVKRIEDPIGLLPAKLILGINKRGVHFFRPVPKEYLHSAELRDIMQFGSSSQVLSWVMEQRQQGSEGKAIKYEFGVAAVRWCSG